MAVASPSTVLVRARTPPPEPTTSAAAPRASAATGVPHAIASTMARPNGSAQAGEEMNTEPRAKKSGS